MELAGFTGWTDETLAPWTLKILPEGWFLVVHQESGEVVATAMANHNPNERHPFAGELGWVAAHPAHAGKGLGMAVCGAVVNRLRRGGYSRIYLNTDDFRLPALKTYLKLGWQPFIFVPDMEQRWREIYTKLNWPMRPEEWLR